MHIDCYIDETPDDIAATLAPLQRTAAVLRRVSDRTRWLQTVTAVQAIATFIIEEAIDNCDAVKAAYDAKTWCANELYQSATSDTSWPQPIGHNSAQGTCFAPTS